MQAVVVAELMTVVRMEDEIEFGIVELELNNELEVRKLEEELVVKIDVAREALELKDELEVCEVVVEVTLDDEGHTGT